MNLFNIEHLIMFIKLRMCTHTRTYTHNKHYEMLKMQRYILKIIIMHAHIKTTYPLFVINAHITLFNNHLIYII